MSNYYIDLTIDTAGTDNLYHKDLCPDIVTANNYKVWQEYLLGRLKSLITPETMETEEYKACAERLRQVRIEEERYRKREEARRAAEQRRSSIQRPKIAYIPAGLTVDYEEDYGYYIGQIISFTPTEYDDYLYQIRCLERWHKKSVPRLIELQRPDAAFAVAIELCRQLPDFIGRDELQAFHDKQRSRVNRLIREAFRALVAAVTAWNNEAQRQRVCTFIEAQTARYTHIRGMVPSLRKLIPTTPFQGEPVSVTREMSKEEQQQAQRRQAEAQRREKARQDAEQEVRSLIPLNKEYEERIFTGSNIDWECHYIGSLMNIERKQIVKEILRGSYSLAALSFLQLAKSMCRHYIDDEHWCHYDDMYDPEYIISLIVDEFRNEDRKGKLPTDTKAYMQLAWQELLASEAHQSYYILGHLEELFPE